MKIMNINWFLAERAKIRPVTNVELDQIRKDTEEISKAEQLGIKIKNNALISSSGNRIYSNFSKNEKYRYFFSNRW